MDFLNELLADPGTFMAQNTFALTLALLFVSVVLILIGGTMFLTDRNLAQERLASPSPGQNRKRPNAPSIRYSEKEAGWLRALQPLYAPFIPKDEDKISVLRTKMMQAGYTNPRAPITFFAVRTFLAAGFGGAVMFVGPILFPHYELYLLIFAAAIALGVGYMIPTYILEKKMKRRKRLIGEGFPDALDMLLVCVESGLGLDAAMARVGDEIYKAHPILSEHFRLVGNELRAGGGRQEALRNFAERTGVEDVRTLVTLLVQSDELGASIAQALRVHAYEMRATRILRAEEAAHKIPVKMAFPLMFGLIPVVMIVTLTPAVLKIVEFVIPILSKSSLPGG